MSKDLSSVRAAVEVVRWAKAEEAKLKALVTEHRAAIEEALGDDEQGTLDGEIVITWASHKKRQLDQSALREAHPELVEEYTNLVEARQFKVVPK